MSRADDRQRALLNQIAATEQQRLDAGFGTPPWEPRAGPLWAGWWPAVPHDDHPFSAVRFWDGHRWTADEAMRLEWADQVGGKLLLDWYLRWDPPSRRVDRRELVDAGHDLAHFVAPLAFSFPEGDILPRTPMLEGDWRHGRLFLVTRRGWDLVQHSGMRQLSWWQRRQVRRRMGM